MHITIGASLRATKGPAAPEVGEAYLYARQLCQRLEEPQQLFPVLRGLWNYYVIRAELQTAHALGEQLLALAQQAQDAAMLMAAHRALGTTLFHLGAVASAHTHFAQGMALYDPTPHCTSGFLYGEYDGVMCHISAASTLWGLGYPDQALARSQEAVALAQQIAVPLHLSIALGSAAICHAFRREVRLTQECAEAALSVAQEQGFRLWIAIGSILYGWALAQQAGQAQEGIAQINQGMMDYCATGAKLGLAHYLALLAEAYGIMGQPEAGLTVLAEALTLVETTGERLYEPKLYRLKGELLLQQSSDNQAEAEHCFQQAISIARSQQAKSWELRAATSLARLWHQQGKREEAQQVLGDIYGWFTEGFDTADLKDAKALLDALGEQRHDI
jgi:predicted ATPase